MKLGLSLTAAFDKGSQQRVNAGQFYQNVLQIAPAHAPAVIHDGQSTVDRVGVECNMPGSRVQGVGHDLHKYRFLDRSGICVSQVFQQMTQVNARLAH